MREKVEIPFDKQTEVESFGKLLCELVRGGVTFTVDFTNDKFIVVLTGGY